MKTAERGVARRYADALLSLAEERGQAEAVSAALEALAPRFVPGEALGDTLANPALPVERKAAIVSALFRNSEGAEELVGRLVALLAARGRAWLLPEIRSVYRQHWNRRHGVVAVAAASAVALAADESARLTGALERLTGRSVELTARTDSALLGGVVLALDGRVYDGSVRARLEALRQRLLDGDRRA